MKRISGIIIAIVLLNTCLTLYADTAKIDIEKTNVRLDETVSVTLEFSTTFNMYAVACDLVYDNTVLEYISSSTNSVNNMGNKVRIVQDLNGVKTYSATVTFKAKSTGKSTLIFSCEGYDNIDEVKYTISKTINIYTAGDINSDGVVNNKDLTRMFQFLSDWDVEVDETALDINNDGAVNNKDLTRLFQFLSDWDVEIF